MGLEQFEPGYGSKCPLCGSENKWYIDVSAPDWTCLVARGKGSITILACADCGCIFASEKDTRKNKDKPKGTRNEKV